MNGVKYIEPQPGFQTKFLSSPADIVIGGGAAGAGKTFVLLLEPLRHKDVSNFGGVIFRRTSPQIRSEGGLWDTSMSLYPHVGANPKESVLEWDLGKSKLKFSHLEHEKNILDWQGSQIPYLAFDELTHFSKKQFFYLLSRNRSTCGVKPYVRATCNPDPESWVAEFISWWVDADTGFPIPERNGKMRYLIIDGDNYIWGDSKDDVKQKAAHIFEALKDKTDINPDEFIKSVTFISGSIYENKELLNVNPQYLANLMAQDAETKAALLEGNWKVVVSENDIYDYAAFLGMFNNVYNAKTGVKYITTDIAMKGSNIFVVFVWDGNELIDALIMDKSKGNQVIDGIKEMARKHRVQSNHILFDNDGVGQFVDGFIPGAVEFNNNARPFPSSVNPARDKYNKPVPESYQNLKTQCYYKSGDNVANGDIIVSEHVANMMYDDKMTIRQRMIFERKAIKRAKADMDGKLQIIGKDEMKTKLNGDSPDLMDALMMRSYFDYQPAKPIYGRDFVSAVGR